MLQAENILSHFGDESLHVMQEIAHALRSPARVVRVVAPLGVLLPSGLGLKLDNQDVGRAGFVRCLPNGCVAEVVMDDKLLGQLRSAKTATFIIFETPEEGIGFPLSLNGLGEGYDKLP